VVLNLVFMFKRLSGDTHKNMISSNKFYGREIGSLRRTQAEREREQLVGGVIGYKSVETRGDWGEIRGASRK
jgi:hypothetical protein